MEQTTRRPLRPRNLFPSVYVIKVCDIQKNFLETSYLGSDVTIRDTYKEIVII